MAHLKRGRAVTPIQALEWWGCMRLARCVNDLRKAGNNIITNMVERNGKRVACYKLAK